MQNYYPPSPLNIDKSVLKPTKEYKTEVIKVISAIVLFFVVYIGLVVLATALALLVSYLGLQIVIFKPTFITLVLGVGLVGLGCMVVFFLIKFIFAVNKYDRSGFVEIYEEEYAQLFSFIRQLSSETDTQMPKHIYLSADVNACVFYDSSFLSMFLPIKKNLVIGLGVVNSLNMSEFKAVIAHEFGHFSQHSMKLGSFVFNVNKIIYNMLYDNEDYTKMLTKFASGSRYFVFFANLTVKIVGAIQWILKKVYVVVNKTNLGLSRQMEHQADVVSAFVSGSNHLVSALKRIEIGDSCYNVLLNSYGNWITENIKPTNAYQAHQEVINHYASEFDIPLLNGLPSVETDSVYKVQSRLIIKDQWASHPSTKDREAFLKNLNIPQTPVLNQSAWNFFGNTEKLQKKMTEVLFANVKYEGDVQTMEFSAFKEKYYLEAEKYAYNKLYKGFYDNRRIVAMNLDTIEENTTYTNLAEFFTTENCLLPRKLEMVKSEKQTLIELLKENSIKSFDFDGLKCTLSDLPVLIKQVEKEQTELQNQLNTIDSEIVKFVLCKCEDKNNMKDLYSQYFIIANEAQEYIDKYEALYVAVQPMFTEHKSYEIVQLVSNLKAAEKDVLVLMKNGIEEAKEKMYLEPEQLNKIELYLSKDLEYFNGTSYNSSELSIFKEAIDLFVNLTQEREFRIKKEMLEKQVATNRNESTQY